MATAAREDGRDATAIRNFICRVHTNPSVAGSAYVELGVTKVLASVFGPREASRGFSSSVDYSGGANITCDFKYAPCAKLHVLDPKTGVPMSVDRTPETQDLERLAAESVAKAISPSVLLERYPKATIEIAILVLQSDGGEWPACLMAASLALADAGVELNGLVSAVSVGRLPSPSSSSSPSQTFVVDLSGLEEAKASSVTTVAYCRALDKVTLVNHRGATSSSSSLASDLGFALESCAVLEKAMKQTLSQAEAKRLKATLLAKGSSASGAGASSSSASSSSSSSTAP